jgi:hypothetical protein
MRSDSDITVTRDYCGVQEEIQLTATANGFYERNVDSDLERAGWWATG